MILNFNDLELKDRYKIISNSITPRPIAWISTESKSGVLNIAPFSYFTPISSNPPAVIVSIGHKKGDNQMKDTLKNILESKRATINFVDEVNLENMHFSSKELDFEVDESKEFNFKTNRVLKDFPPIIERVKGAFFCKFLQKIELKESRTIPIVLEIERAYFDDSIISKNLDIELKNIARVGAKYFRANDRVDVSEIP